MYKKQTLPAIIFLVAAGLSLIFAIVCFSTQPNYPSTIYSRSYTFGADFYTYVQGAAADAANNASAAAKQVYWLAQNLCTMFGFAFLVSAVAFAAVGVGKLTSTPAVQPVAVTNSQQIADTVSANFIKTPEAEVEEEVALPTLE